MQERTSELSHTNLELKREINERKRAEEDLRSLAAKVLKIQDEERRRTHADAVDWDRVDRMLDFGGIRIEHNVLVSDGGYSL